MEDQLYQLKASSSISQNISGLQKLYECVEDFLSTQDGKCLDTVLDGSIMLLDVCSIIKDVLSQMRQSVQELQSSFRRRSNEVSEYMTSRKKITKVIRKCLADLKNNKKNDAEISLLAEVEATTLAVFESILSFVSSPKQNKSLISKLTLTKRVACNEETSEVMEVDTAVKALTKGIEVNNVQKTLKALEMTLQDLEDGLETVFSKKITKVIRKCLANLKNNKKNDTEISLLAEVEATTLAVFESILSFVSVPKQNKSLISKLTITKRVAHTEETSEVMKVENVVKSLTKGIEVKNAQKTLGSLEITLQDLEDGLETVFRCLIKHRVSLLNIN
ncbi:hypothetical protein C5167_004415 [Papaver somniferum]|uniref:Uncharacterized protein n=1 Tax=Papaver somniferum TaxID=3469 RepID=A0A4Y7JAZ0_PAPSO|nr:hypothetical protein C5167_004415 [Papaver somniferum]